MAEKLNSTSMLNTIIQNNLALISAIFVGAAAGYLGSFMVLRRMALVGDALSHVALPGVALGLLFHFNPIVGAFATLLVGIVGIRLIESKTKLATESLVGLFFTISLAIGLLIVPEEDVLEALFGDLSRVTGSETILAVVFSLFVIFLAYRISRDLILDTLSSDLAKANGVNSGRINFVFLLLVALIVALGIKVVGTLLMGALVVIPAIAAKNISRSMRSYSWGSAVLGLLSAAGGILLAQYLHLAPGPLVVLTSGAFFFILLLFKR